MYLCSHSYSGWLYFDTSMTNISSFRMNFELKPTASRLPDGTQSKTKKNENLMGQKLAPGVEATHMTRQRRQRVGDATLGGRHGVLAQRCSGVAVVRPGLISSLEGRTGRLQLKLKLGLQSRSSG